MKFISREFSLKKLPSSKALGVFGVKISSVTKWVLEPHFLLGNTTFTWFKSEFWKKGVNVDSNLIDFNANLLWEKHQMEKVWLNSLNLYEQFPFSAYDTDPLSKENDFFPLTLNRLDQHWLLLSNGCRRERSKVPYIVRQCLEEIERRGMEEVGIYRVSGVATDIQALKTAFDTSECSVCPVKTERLD